MPEGISVIVCCHNSESRLGETLKHLAKQRGCERFPWEIVIVNNNSTDRTAAVAISEWETHSSNTSFRIIDELKPGLNAARDAGLALASYDCIIFCDDDNWLGENYVQTAFAVMAINPRIGVLGGEIEAVCEGTSPGWFDKYKYAYAIGKQGVGGDVCDRGYIWGAGMIFRRKIWLESKKHKIISFLTDRKGRGLSAGGDSELCALAMIYGYKLWYDPALKMKHFVPENRLKWDYVVGLTRGFGASEIGLGPLRNIFILCQNPSERKYRFSWKRELIRTMRLVLRNPAKCVKGLIGGEGDSSVVWLNHKCGYIGQLLKHRRSLDEAFVSNMKILVREYGFQTTATGGDDYLKQC